RLRAAAAGAEPVRPAGRLRPADPVRLAGTDQHGLEPAPDADQGHDPPLHQLRRLVAAGAVDRYWLHSGAQSQALRGRGRAMSVAPLIILAAGGTGGHVFPAEALAEALLARGYRLGLITDSRGAAYGGVLGKIETHHLPLARMSGGVVSRIR